ncbi:MAG: hypothetical protein NZ602_14720 [Thermoguttaceae bacterium]|nr:hypothetical protein [Thermoguttaceae bacterium]MDW8038397.1 hypothetical protein [Thermoguttaceae bacterium]
MGKKAFEWLTNLKIVSPSREELASRLERLQQQGGLRFVPGRPAGWSDGWVSVFLTCVAEKPLVASEPESQSTQQAQKDSGPPRTRSPSLQQWLEVDASPGAPTYARSYLLSAVSLPIGTSPREKPKPE